VEWKIPVVLSRGKRKQLLSRQEIAIYQLFKRVWFSNFNCILHPYSFVSVIGWVAFLKPAMA